MLGSILMVVMCIGAFFALCILFLPTGVAKIRNHPNTAAIFLVNLFLGWTFLGWVVAMIWACNTPAPELTGLAVDSAHTQPAFAPHAASALPAAASFHPQR